MKILMVSMHISKITYRLVLNICVTLLRKWNGMGPKCRPLSSSHNRLRRAVASLQNPCTQIPPGESSGMACGLNVGQEERLRLACGGDKSHTSHFCTLSLHSGRRASLEPSSYVGWGAAPRKQNPQGWCQPGFSDKTYGLHKVRSGVRRGREGEILLEGMATGF